jgi:phosphatidylserine/phosphatidylglycerophosphate/cardiolipin synthase-like enzyme
MKRFQLYLVIATVLLSGLTLGPLRLSEATPVVHPRTQAEASKRLPAPYRVKFGLMTNTPKGAGGSLAQQYVYIRTTIGVLDAMPRGSVFRFVIPNLDLGRDPAKPSSAYVGADQDVLAALQRTYRRGVHVQGVMQRRIPPSGKINALIKTLGTNTRAKSYVRVCEGSCFTSDSSGVMHAKIWTASSVAKPGGGYYRMVGAVGTQHFTGSTNAGSWNSTQVFAGECMYRSLVAFHKALQADRTRRNFPGVSCGNLQMQYFPTSGKPDPWVNALKHVSCKAKPGYGVGGRTLIRVAVFFWSDARKAVAVQLKALRDAGCIVQVAVNNAGDTSPRIVRYLVTAARLPTWDGHWTPKDPRLGIYLHDKTFWVDGTLYGKGRASIYQGSHNLSGNAVHRGNETIIRTVSSKEDVAEMNRWWGQRMRFSTRITFDVAKAKNAGHEPLTTAEEAELGQT